jgi:hypothetical protein
MTGWQPASTASTAPRNRDLEVCVIDIQGKQLFAFPCRQSASGWVKAATGSWVQINRTHWRQWGWLDF